MNSKTVASNKKARFDFFLEERFIAGLALEGWEVKSLRQGKLNIKEAYIKAWAPLTFVLMHSKGLYSAAGTCFKAAACIIISIPSKALKSL